MEPRTCSALLQGEQLTLSIKNTQDAKWLEFNRHTLYKTK